MTQQTKCAWKYDDYEDKWDTMCGEAFTFFENGPLENKMRYCCYCGKPLHECEVTENDDP